MALVGEGINGFCRFKRLTGQREEGEEINIMPKNFEVSGPAFVGLVVRDVAAAADFYEKNSRLQA
jgi:hypothetical protein